MTAPGQKNSPPHDPFYKTTNSFFTIFVLPMMTHIYIYADTYVFKFPFVTRANQKILYCKEYITIHSRLSRESEYTNVLK